MAPRADVRRTTPSGDARRDGITLLEVLVACGILVVGLASLASIMPAAGSRLAQASVEDRAGAMAANAYADILNRGLVSHRIFSDASKACSFGAGIDLTSPDLQASAAVGRSLAGPSAALVTWLDPTRGFVSEDDLVYTVSGTADTPNNQFLAASSGPREYRTGVCWGAVVAPTTYPAAAGSEAVLSVAVFSKAGDSKPLQLQGTAGSNLFQFDTSRTAAEDERDRKTLLPGCSFVLALPLAAADPPRFLKITSSWTNPGPGVVEDVTQRQSFVVLDLDPLVTARAKYVDSSGILTVIAFENLIRVDQYTLPLD
jgi:hypothetical protein